MFNHHELAERLQDRFLNCSQWLVASEPPFEGVASLAYRASCRLRRRWGLPEQQSAIGKVSEDLGVLKPVLGRQEPPGG